MGGARHREREVSSWDQYVQTGGRMLPARPQSRLPGQRGERRGAVPPRRQPPATSPVPTSVARRGGGLALLFVLAYACFLYEQEILAGVLAGLGGLLLLALVAPRP